MKRAPARKPADDLVCANCNRRIGEEKFLFVAGLPLHEKECKSSPCRSLRSELLALCESKGARMRTAPKLKPVRKSAPAKKRTITRTAYGIYVPMLRRLLEGGQGENPALYRLQERAQMEADDFSLRAVVVPVTYTYTVPAPGARKGQRCG
jgi:hypothetical protein